MRRFTQQIKKQAESVSGMVRQAFRGTLNLMSSLDGIQKTQVSGLADETLSDVELMQHFGFTSVPPAGTQAVIIPIGGATSHGIVIATENGQYRILNLQDGEAAVYDKSGSSIILRQGKLVEINCDNLVINAKSKTTIKTPVIDTTAAINADGAISAKGNVSSQGNVSAQGDVSAGNTSLTNHAHRAQGERALTTTPQ